MREIVPATRELVREIYTRLQSADLDEIKALCPEDPCSMMDNSLALSAGAWVLMIDGKPAAVWGVQVLDGDAAAVWMLGTEEVPKNGRFIARYSRSVIDSLLEIYRRVEVLIDARYTASLRWAEWLGFSLGEPAAVGPAGQQFYTAIKTRGGLTMGALVAAIPWLGLGLGAAGLAVKTAADVKAQDAANKAAEYNARVAQQNAGVQQQLATQAVAQGDKDAQKIRQDAETLKGRQRAAYAASGVMVDEGSALDTLADTEMYATDDALTAKYNAQQAAWGHQVEASNYTSQAQLLRMQKVNPAWSAAGGLLTGTSSLLSRV